MNGTYTLIEHDLLDSPAALTLSPGAFGLLVDFTRAWKRETHNGNRETSSIFFTWQNCARPVRRQTWNGWRRELVAHGFIAEAGHNAGRYRMADEWRGYVLTADEQDHLDRHAARQENRKTDTIKARGSRGRKAHPRTKAKGGHGNRTLDIGDENRTLALGDENRTDLNTPNTCNTTSPNPPTGAGGDQPGGGDLQGEAEKVRTAYNEAAAKARWKPCQVFDAGLKRKVWERLKDPEWRAAYPKALASLWAYPGKSNTFDAFLRPRTVRTIIDAANQPGNHPGDLGDMPF